MDYVVIANLLLMGLTFICVILIFKQIKRVLPLTSFSAEKQNKIFKGSLFALIAGLSLVMMIAMTGWLANYESLPPRPGFVILPAFLIVVWLWNNSTVDELLKHIPPKNIIYLQTFRVFVEIALWMFFLANVLPIQMTFEGYNFDILSGLFAIPVAYAVFEKGAPKWIAVLYNVFGLILVTTIVVISILSIPGPTRYFMNEPANSIIGEFPFIWLPVFLVNLAVFLHGLSLKQIFKNLAV